MSYLIRGPEAVTGEKMAAHHGASSGPKHFVEVRKGGRPLFFGVEPSWLGGKIDPIEPSFDITSTTHHSSTIFYTCGFLMNNGYFDWTNPSRQIYEPGD